VLAAEYDDSELVCDSLRYVEPVQLGVQQPRQTQDELVGIGKDSIEHNHCVCVCVCVCVCACVCVCVVNTRRTACLTTVST